MEIPLVAPQTLQDSVSFLRKQWEVLFAGQALQESGDPFFLIKVPLRLAPLGAHSDHQGGVVTGFTINRFVYMLAQAVRSRTVELKSINYEGSCRIEFDAIEPPVAGDWGNYARGAVQAMRERRADLSRGFRGIIFGEMPVGGLSSSAAITLGYLTALSHVNDRRLSSSELVELVRKVENGYLGLHNGILDQSVIVSGTAGALAVIDCATNVISKVEQPLARQPWEVMVVYSGLSRQLTATPFNQRVAECRHAAAEMLRSLNRGSSSVARLGDITNEEFAQLESKLDTVSRKRARHFFSEGVRVHQGVVAWRDGDMKKFGSLVTASGESSIVNYESGSPALIALYEILAQLDGVYGTRFCGGGFQGCCLALIDPGKRMKVCQQLHELYQKRHPELLSKYSIHICALTNSISCEVLS
jgi:galactokinase